MAPELQEKLKSLHGGAEAFAGEAFVALLDFGSGLRYGLVATADGAGDHGRWAVAHEGKLRVFGSGSERDFIELLEHPRRDVDAQIEGAAAKAGLPGLETAWSLPSIELLRATLRGRSQHFARLALAWILPTELRELRADLRACAENDSFPDAVRRQAEHLIVRE